MRLATLALALFMVVLPLPSAAQSGTLMAQNGAEIIFSALEKRILRDVLGSPTAKGEQERKFKPGGKRKFKKSKGRGRGRGGGRPPGLAKRQSLPPGLARQVERNGTLPPGLARRRLPEGVAKLLPRAAPGTERVIIGNDVVLVEQATNRVLDVLRDVLIRSK
jgi:hypothetical protein